MVEIKASVFIFTALFGISAWVDMSGIWIELPLLVNVLPEGWNLPSYLTIIIQVANIGPITYTIANRLAPNKVTEWPVIYIIIGTGIISCWLLVFFWDTTSVIGGQERSTGLLGLCSALSLVDCTSSVVYLPYMALYKSQYLKAYFIGEGLSTLIPTMVGFAQGVSQQPICMNISYIDAETNFTTWKVNPEYPPPRFSIETFWWILSAMICLSGVSFSLLHWLPYSRTERIDSSHSYTFPMHILDHSPVYVSDSSDNQVIVQGVPGKFRYEHNNCNFQTPKKSLNKGEKESTRLMTTKEFSFYLITVTYSCCLLFGIMPGIQSYSCLPYGNLAYTLSMRLGAIASVIVCFVALFLPPLGMAGIGILVFLGSGFCAHQIVLAAMSPYPPLHDQNIGVMLIVTSSVIFATCLTYARVAASVNLGNAGGHNALLWCGVGGQAGSFSGAIIAFLCVNVLGLFTSAPPCPIYYAEFFD